MGGMSKASTDPLCSAPLRQRETRLGGCEGVRLLSACSTPKKWWCKRCNTPLGNLIQTLLPAVILLLQGKIAKQVSPYPSILTLIIAGNYTHVLLYYIAALSYHAMIKIYIRYNNDIQVRSQILPLVY